MSKKFQLKHTHKKNHHSKNKISTSVFTIYSSFKYLNIHCSVFTTHFLPHTQSFKMIKQMLGFIDPSVWENWSPQKLVLLPCWTLHCIVFNSDFIYPFYYSWAFELFQFGIIVNIVVMEIFINVFFMCKHTQEWNGCVIRWAYVQR